MLLKSLVRDHFITLVLIGGFSIILSIWRRSQDVRMRYLWLTICCTAALVVEDSLEIITSLNPDLRFWRILLSIIGYSLRPIAALGVVLVMVDPNQKVSLLWLPAIINTLVMCTAFFSPLAFSYDANYEFVRGPLGYSAFITAYFYIMVVLWFTHKRFREGRSGESRVLYLCAFACFCSGLVDAICKATTVNSAIISSSIFYYMFIRAQDTDRDSLTKLLNRQSFYEDCGKYKGSVSAVALVDMNGLKRVNDNLGHDAGDQALRAIGQCLSAASDRSVIPYRIGGDEFVVLFLKLGEWEVQRVLDGIRSEVETAGYSVSIGYACDGGEDIDAMLRVADGNMYADKTRYYSGEGRNRRRRDEWNTAAE